MLKTETATIGNHTYHVRQLGASSGRKMLVRLVKIFGPAFGAVLDDPDARAGSVSIANVKLVNLARAIEELSSRLSEEDLEHVCATFGECTQLEIESGKLVPLDKQRQELHFAGAYSEMFSWIGFCLRVNYADFLGGMQSMIGSPASATAEAPR